VEKFLQLFQINGQDPNRMEKLTYHHANGGHPPLVMDYPPRKAVTMITPSMWGHNAQAVWEADFKKLTIIRSGQIWAGLPMPNRKNFLTFYL